MTYAAYCFYSFKGDEMYDMDEYLFLMYLKWNDQESVDDIKEAFKVFDKVSWSTLDNIVY